MFRHLWAPTFLFLTFCWTPPAAAKSTKTLAYRYPVVWSTTIRFLRADRGYKIEDKDKENGYVLFVFPGKGAVKDCAAALELFQITDEEGAQKVRLQLNIAHQPSYVEIHLLDQLESKLREERGAPRPEPVPPPKKKEPAPPQQGADVAPMR